MHTISTTGRRLAAGLLAIFATAVDAHATLMIDTFDIRQVTTAPAISGYSPVHSQVNDPKAGQRWSTILGGNREMLVQRYSGSSNVTLEAAGGALSLSANASSTSGRGKVTWDGLAAGEPVTGGRPTAFYADPGAGTDPATAHPNSLDLNYGPGSFVDLTQGGDRVQYKALVDKDFARITLTIYKSLTEYVRLHSFVSELDATPVYNFLFSSFHSAGSTAVGNPVDVFQQARAITLEIDTRANSLPGDPVGLVSTSRTDVDFDYLAIASTNAEVPEPGTIVLLGIGLALIAIGSRKRLFK